MSIERARRAAPDVRSLIARYGALFRHAGAARFAALSLVMRMPLGTVGLATLLHLRELDQRLNQQQSRADGRRRTDKTLNPADSGAIDTSSSQ